jgi:hypothetical protein
MNIRLGILAGRMLGGPEMWRFGNNSHRDVVDPRGSYVENFGPSSKDVEARRSEHRCRY